MSLSNLSNATLHAAASTVMCLLLCAVATAGAAPLVVKKLSYQVDMPYVVSDDGRVAQRINTVIYLDTLDVPPPAAFQDGLKIKKTDSVLTPISEITFELARNDDAILALSVSYEGCGAYCENNTLHFNFEAATGRNVVAADLFTPAGAAAVNRLLDAARLAAFKGGISNLRKEARATAKSRAVATDEASDFEAAIAMYEDCAKSMTDPAMAQYRRIDLSSMLIGKTGVSFVRGRCSNHAMHALDDVGDITTSFVFKELMPHLSGYGKYLLLGADKTAPAGGPFNQVLVGKIGASAITLRLSGREKSGGVSGLYFYDKFRTSISLSGTVTGSTLNLEEDAGVGKAKPVIRASISGESMKGQWTLGDRMIAFEAAP